MGLSPRVRGNPRSDVSSRLWERSIPACAGEPQQNAYCDPNDEVYPRVCGGTQSPLLGPFPDPGLSPRVRGNQCA